MKPVAIFLYELSGQSAAPFADAGWECICVDIAHPETRTEGNITYIKADARDWKPSQELKDRCKFFAAFPPCDHMAVSGARWFKGKGLHKLAQSIELFAIATEWADELGVPFFIENPVSTISTYWRKPDYKFDPWQYTDWEPRDNYSKKTCLWAGNDFVMPSPAYPADVVIDTLRIVNEVPGPNRQNIRSATPIGFMRAVYETNFGVPL